MDNHKGDVTSYFPFHEADKYLYPSTWEQQENTVSCATYSHPECQEPVDWEFWLTPEALEERSLVSVNAPRETDKGS